MNNIFKNLSIGTQMILLTVISFFVFAVVTYLTINLQLNSNTRLQLENTNKNLIDGKTAVLENYLNIAFSIIEEKYKADSLPEEVRKQQAAEELAALKFDKGAGYFFAYEIHNDSYSFAFHGANKSLWGKPVNINDPDPKGYAFRVDLIKNALEKNGKVVEYFYEKPNTKELIKKMSAGQYFEPWKWVVVTGFYIDDVEKNMAQQADTILKGKRRILTYLTLISLILIGVVGLSIFYLNNFIIKSPLQKATDRLSAMANGDLSLASEGYLRNDEVGLMLKSQQEMIEKLNKIISTAEIVTAEIADNCAGLQAKSQMLSQGANELAASVEEVSSSMEQMLANIEQNSENSKQTNKIALDASSRIKMSSDTSLNAVRSMQHIAERINVINDIAFQTNILALNAAVEAARAGEQGRGFAVVAAEVRKLAERSKSAATEISEVSVDTLNKAKNAGSELEKLVPEIDKTANLVQEITASSQEQAAGAGQINNAVQQLNAVTQHTASASEEIAASAESLLEMAEQLKSVISFFKLNKSK